MIFSLIAFVQNAATDSLAANKIAQNSQKFTEIDPWGVGMTFVGMTVVFLSLLLLYILFFNITKILLFKKNRALKKEGKEEVVSAKEELTGEINAAIAAALAMHFNEMHDKESTVLTINRVARAYSPWSSKIYGLRQYPR